MINKTHTKPCSRSLAQVICANNLASALLVAFILVLTLTLTFE